MTNREFKERMADLVAQQRRAAYEGAGHDKPATKKPPAPETAAKVKTRRKKA